MTAEVDPFSQVRIRKPSTISQEQPSNNQNDPFQQVRIKPVEGFSFIKEGGRHAARLASRVAETIGGIPGDVGEFIQSGVFKGLEKLTGIETPEKSREKAKKYRSPTSSELKETSQKLTQGFTAPKNDVEKTIDDYVETAASLFGPMKFRKALWTAAAGTGAKKGLELSGIGKEGQEAGKLGTIFISTLLNRGASLKYADEMYKKANELSKGASITSKNLSKNLIDLRTSLEKGVTTPQKNAIIKPIEDLLVKSEKGKILVEDLTAAKRDINTLIKDPILLKREKKLLNLIGKYVDDAIKPYEKLNPKFAKVYRPANEIYGAVMQGTKASDFIKKHLGVKSIIGTALTESAMGVPEYIIPSVAGMAGSLGVAKGIDFFTRLAKSNELRKFYAKGLISAAKEDVGALRKAEEGIKQILEKD